MDISILSNKYLDKQHVAVICILGMFTGFLVSPAVLSISMIVYGVSGLRDVHPRLWLRDRYWLLGVAWILCYALSWFWSEDKESWSIYLQVKLPFLILPLAFAHTPRFSPDQFRQITLVMGLLLLAGALYSISFLIRDSVYYISEYKFAHLLPTPARQDHISFSLSITLYIIWAVYAWPFLSGRFMKVTIAVIMVLLAVYIHILAAKSGIVALYIFLLFWSIYLVFTRMKLAGIFLVVAIPLFVVLAVKYIPTFSSRKDYLDYTLFMHKVGDKSGNYGDVNRLIAYELALRSIKQHPLVGVGTGDMLSEMRKGYQQYYPKIEEKDVLIPHNQFLIVALGCGIPAMLVFAVWVFMPLAWLRRNRRSFFFFMVWLILLFQLSIDTALEAQMCIFIFVFFFLQQKKELDEQRFHGE